MTNLQPTPITDKNGKATTVHKKVADATTGSSRVAALGTTPKPVKLTPVKKPDGYYPNVKDSDVVEVGPKKPDSYNNEQDIYLNGKIIATLRSSEETQHSKLGNSRLIKYGADRKVWRTSGRGPKLGNYDGFPISRSEFSRGRAVYETVDGYNRAEINVRREQAYIDNGGIYFEYTGENKDWAVNGKVVEAPEGTELRVRTEPGWLTKNVVLQNNDHSWVRAEINFDSDSDSTPVTFKLEEGIFNFYSFERDGSLWAHQGNLELSENFVEFIDKVEEFTKSVFAANKE